MNWVRCPRCHTLTDVDQSKQCDGCNGALEAAPLAPISRSGRPSAAQEAGARDLSRSQRVTLVLLILAILGFGTLLSRGGHGFKFDSMDEIATLLLVTALTFLVTVGLFFRVFTKHVWRDPPFGLAGYLLAAVLAVVGAGLLIFLTCSLTG